MKLRKTTKVIWLFTLCVFVSGCTTYRPSSIPDAVPEMGSGEESPSVLEGDTVRIILYSGKGVSGKVLWMTNEEIALGSRGNYGDEDLIIKVSTIEYVEVREQSDGELEKRWFLGLGAAAVIGAYIGLRSINMN